MVGGKSLIRMFDQHTRTIMPNVERAVARGCMLVERYAKEYVTEWRAIDTGTLRRSIKGGISKEESGPTVVVGKIGTSVHYAVYVHEGHMAWKKKWIPPKPFLKMGMDKAQKEIEAMIKLAVWKDFGKGKMMNMKIEWNSNVFE